MKRIVFLTTLAVLASACAEDKQQTASSSTAAEAGKTSAAGVGSTSPASSTPPVSLPSVSCDGSPHKELQCGGVTCPAPAAPLPGTCSDGCCTESGKCGMRVTTQVNGQSVSTVCLESNLDSSCPSKVVAGLTTPGCCASGRCGQLTLGTCVADSVGQACGGTDKDRDGGV